MKQIHYALSDLSNFNQRLVAYYEFPAKPFHFAHEIHLIINNKATTGLDDHFILKGVSYD